MSPQAGWILQEEVVPRLKASIPRNVNQVGAEDSEELIQDAIVMAAKLMHTVECQGKTVTAGNIAYYTILHMKSGRRSYGISTTDVCGISTQLNGSTRLSSLEEPAAMDGETGGELLAFHDVLSQDQDDPGMIAARKLDWQALLARLTEREIVAVLAGRTVSEVALVFQVSRSAMQLCKNRLVELIQEFMGVDILVEVRRLPGWRNDLNTTKEKLACRFERRN